MSRISGLWVRCRSCYASLEVRGLSLERGDEGFEVTAVACPLCGTEHKLRPPMYLNRGSHYKIIAVGDK
jgi:hypothetical protein